MLVIHVGKSLSTNVLRWFGYFQYECFEKVWFFFFHTVILMRFGYFQIYGVEVFFFFWEYIFSLKVQ